MNHKKNDSGYTWGIILLVFGFLFLLQNFDMLDVGDVISTYWPLIIIAVGINVLLKRQRGDDETIVEIIDTSNRENTNNGQSGQFSSINRINENSVFGDLNLTLVTDDFKGGSASNVFGDIHIDLTQIKIQDKECRLSITGVFGDILIKTPKDVPIRVASSVTAGDIAVRAQKRDGLFNDLTFQDPGYAEGDPRMMIRCSMVFGSVNIF